MDDSKTGKGDGNPNLKAPSDSSEVQGSAQNLPSSKQKVVNSITNEDDDNPNLKAPRDWNCLPSPAPLNTVDDPNPKETNPALIKQPISAHVHCALTGAWEVNQTMRMAFIFDAISPARQFKRGAKFRESKPFPTYDESKPGYTTETEPKYSLMPYLPANYE